MLHFDIMAVTAGAMSPKLIQLERFFFLGLDDMMFYHR